MSSSSGFCLQTLAYINHQQSPGTDHTQLHSPALLPHCACFEYQPKRPPDSGRHILQVHQGSHPSIMVGTLPKTKSEGLRKIQGVISKYMVQDPEDTALSIETATLERNALCLWNDALDSSLEKIRARPSFDKICHRSITGLDRRPNQSTWRG